MSYAVLNKPSKTKYKLDNIYGKPPEDLAQTKNSITDFFLAAEFEPVISQDFIDQYARKSPAWGPIGYVTYKRTYARPLFPIDFNITDHAEPDKAIRTEEAHETLTRIINGLWHILRCHSARKHIDFSEEIAQRKAEQMFIRMWNFKWLPPGRGLWMMGTKQMYLKGSAALQNCFSNETEILTSEGNRKIGDLVNQTVTLMTEGGKWVDAPIMSFGKQELMKVTLSRQGIEKEIFATPDHRWFVKSKKGSTSYQRQERYTRELASGNRMMYVFGQGIKDIRPSAFGIAHGIVFGDGSQSTTSKNAFVYLCGSKDRQLEKYFPLSPRTEEPNKCEGGALLVADLPNTYRKLPELTESKSYLYGWLAGYFAADGSCASTGATRIASVNKSNMEFVRDICYKIGIGTYGVREETRISNLTNTEFTMYTVTLMRDTLDENFFLLDSHKENFIKNGSSEIEARHWNVISVEKTDRFEEVFCPQVPDTNSFVLADNILTGNCGFCSTANIDKEFSEPFAWAMDMSMLGVGIGFDTKGAGKTEIVIPSNIDMTTVPFTRINRNHKTYNFVERNSYTVGTNGSAEVVEEDLASWEKRKEAQAQSLLPKDEEYSTYTVEKNFDQFNVIKHLWLLDPSKNHKIFVVPDSREGWVESVAIVIDAFLKGKALPIFDYSLIRERGTPIRGFGGIAEGPKFLRICHENLTAFFLNRIGKQLTGADIVDIFNEIGACVVSGNVRRSAMISLGQANDQEFITLKHDLVNHPNSWGSNNSIFATVGMDYTTVAELLASRGEPGLIWLDAIQKYGRMGDPVNNKDKNAQGTNPCAEQSLHDRELCCVSGDTKITTKSGIVPIIDTIGKKVEVWNGNQWSRVTPFLAAKNKDLYRVLLSDGSYLDVTDNHQWKVRKSSSQKWLKLQTKDLQAGMQLPEFHLDTINGKQQDHAYEHGLVCGDGFIDGKRTMLTVHGKERELVGSIAGKAYKEQHPQGYTEPFQRFNMSQSINIGMGQALRDKNSLPKEVFTWNRTSVLSFIAGYIDSDGSISVNTNAQGYKIHGSEGKMRDLQILCRIAGIDHTSIYIMKGQKQTTIINGITAHRNYPIWVCQIPSFECGDIPTRVKPITQIASRYMKNNAYDNSIIDGARKQKIISITKVNNQDVYCFTEPINHMGVFGNVLTYQCLVENFPSRHNTTEDFLLTLKQSYLYAKAVTLVPSHSKKTNAVMGKNSRIGCSLSGIQDARLKFGTRKFLEMADAGYKYIQDRDLNYSDWLQVRRSIKTTSLKPSGTVSLLPGVKPGIHRAVAKYRFKNMRFSKSNPMVEVLQNAGYKTFLAEQPDTTICVAFPVKEDYMDMTESESADNIWEQLEFNAQMQEIWSDNQNSITVKFKQKPGIEKEIKSALEMYETRLKSVSFLPYWEPEDEAGYVGMPDEPISEETYNNYLDKLKPYTFTEAGEEDLSVESCESGACPIR